MVVLTRNMIKIIGKDNVEDVTILPLKNNRSTKLVIYNEEFHIYRKEKSKYEIASSIKLICNINCKIIKSDLFVNIYIQNDREKLNFYTCIQDEYLWLFTIVEDFIYFFS